MADPKTQARQLSATAILSQQCMADSERWFGDSQLTRNLPYNALAMCGEAGEFANLVKKVQRGSLDIHDARVRHDLAMELTDVFVYMLNIAGILGVDLERSYDTKRRENEARFVPQRLERERKRGAN